MDLQQLATIFGLPTAITAVLTVLVKALFNVRPRRSKESLLNWLTQASAVESFKGDEKALRALRELQQSLVFERAFGLKAESTLRNELLAFADANQESLKFQEVMDAGRLVSGLTLAQLRNPKRIKAFKVLSRVAKLLGYLYITVCFLLSIGGMFLPVVLDLGSRQTLASVVFGLVSGGLIGGMGVNMLKQGRHLAITTAFLGSRSNNQRSSIQLRYEKTDGEAVMLPNPLLQATCDSDTPLHAPELKR